jgi:polyisoprenoid-binding protein YceI
MKTALTLGLLAAATAVAPSRAQTSAESPPAGTYAIDAAHAGVSFKISHVGLSWCQGRFDSFSGGFTLDPDPAKASFDLTMKVDSIDTNNPQRDGHLKSPDFLDAKQFPTITFKSTSVRPIQGGLAVTGDLTMHGETKPVAFNLVGGRTAEFPKGTRRVGYSTDLVVKRTNFGVGKMTEMIGDDVYLSISFEGVLK